MMIITCTFYVLVLLILIAMYLTLRKPKINEIIVPKIDVSLTDINEFIRRETLFNFISWFNSRVAVKNMSNPDQSSTLISELKKPELIKEKMQVITLNIIATMSPSLKNAFFTVYNKGAYDSPDDMLSTYVSRQVMFFIRRVNVDITALFTNNQNDSVDKLLKQYVVSIENEIYKNNDIEILSSDNFAEEQEGVQE